MVIGDGEGHELLERHLVAGIDVEELRRHRCELEALLDDAGADEEARGDLLLAQAGVPKGLEGPELVERMEGDALNVLGQAVFLGRPTFANDAGDGLGLGHTLLLYPQLQRPDATAAGRHPEYAGRAAPGVPHRTPTTREQ